MVNGDKTIINRTEPMTLNKTWKNAALLAGIDPPIEARTAVIVGRERDRKSAEQYYEEKFSKRGTKQQSFQKKKNF